MSGEVLRRPEKSRRRRTLEKMCTLAFCKALVRLERGPGLALFP